MSDKNNVEEFFKVLKNNTLCDNCWMDNKIKKKAQWKVTWSDRESHVCDAHLADAVRAYNGDHEYDKIDLTFTEIVEGSDS
jgi:hypothetical protein